MSNTIESIVQELAKKVDILEAENKELNTKVKQQRKYIDNLEKDMLSYKCEYDYTEEIKEYVISGIFDIFDHNDVSLFTDPKFLQFLFRHININEKVDSDGNNFLFRFSDLLGSAMSKDMLKTFINLNIDLNHKNNDGENYVNWLAKHNTTLETDNLISLLETAKESGMEINNVNKNGDNNLSLLYKTTSRKINDEIDELLDSNDHDNDGDGSSDKELEEVDLPDFSSKSIIYGLERHYPIFEWFINNCVDVDKKFIQHILTDIDILDNTIEEIHDTYKHIPSKEISKRKKYSEVANNISEIGRTISKLLIKSSTH